MSLDQLVPIFLSFLDTLCEAVPFSARGMSRVSSFYSVSDIDLQSNHDI